jgi:hypothetical protein
VMGDARATSSSVAALVVSPMPSRSCASSSACWRIGAAGVCRRDRFTVLPVAPPGHVARSGCRKPSLIESAMTRLGPTHGLVAHYDYIFTAQFNVRAPPVSSRVARQTPMSSVAAACLHNGDVALLGGIESRVLRVRVEVRGNVWRNGVPDAS